MLIKLLTKLLNQSKIANFYCQCNVHDDDESILRTFIYLYIDNIIVLNMQIRVSKLFIFLFFTMHDDD